MCFPVETSVVFEVELVASFIPIVPIPSSDDMSVASSIKWNIDIGTWCLGMQYQNAASWRA